MNNQFDLFLQKLEGLGLSANEAMIYMALLEKSPLTGYEVAKRCNLSRGSIYTTLERLTEKRAVHKTVDNKYLAVDLKQFLKMRQGYFADCIDYLNNNYENLNLAETYENVLFIHGHNSILNRVKEMISSAKREISLTAFREELRELQDILILAKKRKVKLNIMSFGKVTLNGLDIVSHSREDWVMKKLRGRFLNIVKDIEEGLIGSLDDTENCGASWSKNPHYCTNIHLYINHEIALIRVFSLLDKATILKIHTDLEDELTRTILKGMPSFNQVNL